ncbi:glycosyltransferase, partial [Candidatus Woesebacteria bacterium]|nr:glycosyltransferase [Candidatus Woesebacteria bacterium]
MNNPTQKPYKVGIDARLVYQTGVGVYIRNLILHLSKMRSESIEFHIYARGKDIVRLKDQISTSHKGHHFVFHITQVSWHSFAEQVIFLIQLLRDRMDLMHFPYFSWPIAYFRPFVATVHDTILLTQATGKATTKSPLIYWIKHIVFRFVLLQQVKRAKSIIVPSHSVAKELIHFYPGVRHKIEVVYEGVDWEFQHASLVPNERLQDTKFFLYVGNCYPHKNVDTLLQAFGKLVEGHTDATLCLVGPRNSFSEKIRSQVFKEGLQRSVLFLHNIPAGELKWL